MRRSFWGAWDALSAGARNALRRWPLGGTRARVLFIPSLRTHLFARLAPPFLCPPATAPPPLPLSTHALLAAVRSASSAARSSTAAAGGLLARLPCIARPGGAGGAEPATAPARPRVTSAAK